LGDVPQFGHSSGGRIGVVSSDDASACELFSEQRALFRVQGAAFGSVADQTRRGQRARHGPVAIRVEDLEKEQQIETGGALPVVVFIMALSPPRAHLVADPFLRIRLQWAGQTGQRYIVEASKDLQIWEPIAPAVERERGLFIAELPGTDRWSFFRVRTDRIE
jgi:hypothetical protein